ncbi:MAG: thiosulfate oxidation carrier complex protein SoxZ [Candidatus Rokubacteria bacterium]|nr:thiosulfate oxidation carrier complex protein SoxZ [Candidatus Rokubacteria bacterium]
MISRRCFLVGSIAAGLAPLVLPEPSAGQGRPDAAHTPRIELPVLADDPAAVPFQAALDHPMDPDHFIRSLEVTLATDPVPSKGKFHFTPANGRAWVAFQFRSGIGGVVTVAGECSRHGRFAGTREVRVVEGGCATTPDRTARERIGNPQIRLGRSYRPGEVVEVRTRLDHASYTGLALKGGKFVRELPEFYVTRMLVSVDDRRVSEFEMTSAVSANPLIRFPLKIGGGGTLRVVFVNSEGRRWEATQPLRPA